jgi:hypothetical protein
MPGERRERGTHCLPAIGFDQDCRLALFLVHCVFIPAAGLPAPPVEVQAAIEPAASKRGRGKGAAAPAAAAALVASQAAADSADAEMRQDLAGDEMKSAAVCIVALCESLQKLSSEEQRSALNDRMQYVAAKSSKEAVIQSLGGDLFLARRCCSPWPEGPHDRAAESLACGAAGDNGFFFLSVGGSSLLDVDRLCSRFALKPSRVRAAGTLVRSSQPAPSISVRSLSVGSVTSHSHPHAHTDSMPLEYPPTLPPAS